MRRGYWITVEQSEGDFRPVGTVWWSDPRAPGKWKQLKHYGHNKFERHFARDVRFLPGSRGSVSVTEHGAVYVHELNDPNGKIVRRLAGYEGLGRAIAVTPDGQFAAAVGQGRAADEPGELRVWDLRTDADPLTVQGVADSNDIGLSSDGRLLLTRAASKGSKGVRTKGDVRLFVRNHRHRAGRRPDPNAWVIHTVFSPDDQWAALTLGGKAAVVMRATDWTEQYRIPPFAGETHVTRIAVSPDSLAYRR